MYNRKEIMKRAWKMIKINGLTLKKALKISWIMEKKAISLKREWNVVEGEVKFRFWKNYGKARAYYTCSWFSNYANKKNNNYIDLGRYFDDE